MSQVPAWHFFKSPRHHTNAGCPESQSTPPNKQLAGTGNKPLCLECKKLNMLGK